jgi:hypothetical protein
MLFSSYTQYFIHPLTFTCHHRLEGLWYLRPCPRHSNNLRGSGIINPASTAAMTRGVSTSSIPPPSQQRLEGPLHHRLHLRHYPSLNNSSSAISQLEKLCHYLRHHRLLRHKLDIIIISFNHVTSFPHKCQPRGDEDASGTNLHKKINLSLAPMREDLKTKITEKLHLCIVRWGQPLQLVL